MAGNVIHIFGASGSGTSTIGQYICKKCGYYFMDTDNYFWELTDPPYAVKRPVSERIALMKNDIDKYNNVVISGSLVDWGDELIALFTFAIRVETPTDIRIERLRRREREKFGSRIQVGGDMYYNHCAFIEWAAAYDKGNLDMRSKIKHDFWQKKLHCPLLLLDGSLSLKDNFEIIKRNLSI